MFAELVLLFWSLVWDVFGGPAIDSEGGGGEMWTTY